MKKLLISFFAAVFISTLCSCSGWLDDCGPFDEGHTWEKKDHVFMVPFYPDSATRDTIIISMGYVREGVTPEIVYSTTLDSFRITTNVRGSYFHQAGADTIWKPSYQYDSGYRWLSLSYRYNPYIATKQPSQSPQCSPKMDHVEVQKVRIEVPQTIKYITFF